MRSQDEVKALPESEWLGVTIRCPETGVATVMGLGELELGPGYVNWLTYTCDACGHEHRAGSGILNVSH